MKVLRKLQLVGLGLLLSISQLKAQPIITNQPANQTNVAGTSVTFSVGVNGTGPCTYQWRFNGTNLPTSFITTVAGNGTAGYFGDGNVGPDAALSNPLSVALDATGNLFIADELNSCIRKVDTNGIITTVAGTGQFGYSFDGGLATNTTLAHPWALTLDAADNLYIADEGGTNRVRKVDTNGIITTVAGNLLKAGYSGDGGPATNAGLAQIVGLALDAVGNIYLVDNVTQRIRKVATNGIITTVAGTGATGYAGDGGAATNATFNFIHGLTADPAGVLYIADHGNHRIRRIDTNGIITTFAGNGTGGFSGDGGAATSAELDLPNNLGMDPWGNLYIADNGNNRIRKVGTNGIITTVAGKGTSGYTGDGGVATNATLKSPWSATADSFGNAYIADSSNNAIRRTTACNQPALTLYDIDAHSAGNYSIVITNASGSITSAVAVLAVTIPKSPPQLVTSGPGFGYVSNRFTFGIIRAYGQSVVIDGSTNLMNWAPITTNTLDTSPFQYTDSTATNSRRFYRARLP